MSRVVLETAAMRAAIALVRRALHDVYLPGDDALEPYQRDIRRVLVTLDDLEIALVHLDVALSHDGVASLPF